jgi:hypothetical protein
MLRTRGRVEEEKGASIDTIHRKLDCAQHVEILYH